FQASANRSSRPPPPRAPPGRRRSAFAACTGLPSPLVLSNPTPPTHRIVRGPSDPGLFFARGWALAPSPAPEFLRSGGAREGNGGLSRRARLASHSRPELRRYAKILAR